MWKYSNSILTAKLSFLFSIPTGFVYDWRGQTTTPVIQNTRTHPKYTVNSCLLTL
jgi:hypothetical protein